MARRAASPGHVIGLGDRHSSNILIHKRTANIVHIDLGVAFEQGRFLNTPEMVPFRLTRDMVDGMGITGAAPEPSCMPSVLTSHCEPVMLWRLYTVMQSATACTRG